MAEFVVNTTQLQDCSTQMAALQRELDAVAVKLGAMQLGSVLQIKASTALIARVGDCKWAAAHQSDDLGSLAAGLREIAELYASCEKGLKDPKTGEAASGQSGSGSDGNYPEWFKDVLDFLDIFGEGAGGIGAILGILRMFDGTGEEIAGGMKNILSGLSEILDKAGSSGGSNDIFDILLGMAENGVDTWDDAFQNFINGHVLSSENSAMQNAGVICKWGSYVMAMVASGFQNYDEFGGDMSNARFWGETVTQGAVDIALGIGAGIVAAAILPATTPALVVGLAGAGAVWVANTVFEWATDENIGEYIANVVCNGVEAVVNVAEDIGEGIADAAEAVWSGFCGWVGSW